MSTATELNRKQSPNIVRPRFFEFPKVESSDSDFYVYFNNQVSLVKVDLVYPSFSNDKVSGVILAKMLTEGTEKLTSTDIHETIARYGAHLEIKAGSDRFVITLYSQKKYLDQLLSFLADIVFNASFPDTEVQKVKTIEIQNLQVNNEKTSHLASNEFKKLLFGESHTYGYVINEADIQEVTKEKLAAFHHLLLSRKPEVFLCGDFSSSTVNVIKNLFQQSDKHVVQKNNFEINAVNEAQFYFKKEGALQSSIRIGNISLNRSHPDFVDMVIANEILGGYFGSRLMKNIREEKGLTYGIYSQCATLTDAAYWVIAADVKKDLVATATAEINKEITLLIKEGVEEDELEVVSNYMAGSFLSSINTPFDIIDKFKLVHYHQLDYGYFETFYNRLFTINSNDIQRVASLYFDKNIEVVVG